MIFARRALQRCSIIPRVSYDIQDLFLGFRLINSTFGRKQYAVIEKLPCFFRSRDLTKTVETVRDGDSTDLAPVGVCEIIQV